MAENILRLSQLLEITPVIDSGTATLRSRGNRVQELPVPLVLESASEMAAALYCHTLPWSLPASGELRFEEQLGAETRSWTYASAAWRTAQVGRSNGTAVVLQIQFVVAGIPTVE